MSRLRTLAVASAVAIGAGLAAGPVGPAAAAGADPSVGTQVLDLLCASKAGSPVFTPFTISRCQDVRARDGLVVEQLICEGLLEGTFQSVASTNRPNRVNWFCIHGPTTA